VHETTLIFLSVVRARGMTPESIISSGRFNAEVDYEEIASEFEGVVTRNDQVALKRACLKRDGNKCLISGFYDISEAMKLPLTERNALTTTPTQVAHIIPFSLGNTPVRIFTSLKLKSLLN
jgi:hypothetical protein